MKKVNQCSDCENEPILTSHDIQIQMLDQIEESETALNQLLFAVERRFPGETRFGTALRYIREAEERAREYRHREKQKVKRWMWVNLDNRYIHNRYLSEEEADQYRNRNAGIPLEKLLWSEMEFEK